MPSGDVPVSLRPAVESDYDFLYSLHVATMREHVERIWGWDDRLQSELYRSNFDPARIQIIIRRNLRIGMLSIENGDHDLYLRQIEILPEFQGAGIGARIVRDVIQQGRRNKKSVSLRVLRHNQARDLYERLGFEVVQESETHIYMKTADPDPKGSDATHD
jgi:ribosomal protein S18 acetylase RimI-like enzyme